MENEIDLGKYVQLLFERGIFIAGLGLLCAILVGGTFFFLIPNTYEANALLIITQPLYTISFDPRFETETQRDVSLYEPLADLARSDTVISELTSRINEPDAGTMGMAEMRAITRVVFENNSNLITLKATAQDPVLAAQIVNAWADILVRATNELFGDAVQEVHIIETQITQIELDRESVEKELVEFQATNQMATLRTEIIARLTLLDRLINEQGQLAQISQDLEGFRIQLAEAPGASQITYEQEMTLLVLQLRTFNADGLSLQLQLPPAETQARRTVREARLYLNELGAAISHKQHAIQAQLDPLEAEILALQSRLKELETADARLEQRYEVIRESHLTLSRKAEESRIAAELPGGTIQLGSYAVVPDVPVSKNTLLSTVLAGAFGMLLGAFLVLAQDFLRRSGRNIEEPRQKGELGLDSPA